MNVIKQYSASAQVRIDELKDRADAASYAACVVDCQGMYDADGRIPDDDDRRRFEVRSLQHVRVYGFTVVYANAIAKERM